MRGELLLNATDKNTTQTGPTYDIGYAYPINTIILRSVVNVDSVSGGNVVVSVQDSLDGVLWRTLYIVFLPRIQRERILSIIRHQKMG